MKLKIVQISNYRSIVSDKVTFSDFTFFVGKNNYGKSNYLKAIDDLLSFSKKYNNIKEIQNNQDEPIVVEGIFEGIKEFTPLLKSSKHKDVVEGLLNEDGDITLRLTINVDGDGETLPVDYKTGETVNPAGWASNYKKIFPTTIFVPATAETADELQEKSSTALSKIKKEILNEFFTSLSTEIEKQFEPIDKYLHDEKERHDDLKKLEKEFAEEMMGEFSTVIPSIKFTLPDASIVGKGMKIYLHDGFHDCEVEQKGLGLQRTTLFALFRLLSNHQTKLQSKPSPILLIEEIEAFLHPSAQKKLSESILVMSEKYQTISTTHSPFVLSEGVLGGYRKVFRLDEEGTICCGPQSSYEEFKKKDYDIVKNSLVYSDNLISLFSDTIAIVEGKQDKGFYKTILDLLEIKTDKMSSFVETVGGGNCNFHVSYKFFKIMGFKKIFIIADLDCLFNNNFKNVLNILEIENKFIEKFRTDIGWDKEGNPSLEHILKKMQKINNIELNKKLEELKNKKIFVLSKGSPDNYYSEEFKKEHDGINTKELWKHLVDSKDIVQQDELKSILENIN